MSSENIEPAFVHMIGEYYRRFQEAKESNDPEAIERVCRNWWLAMQAMQWSVICLRTGRQHAEDYIHVSLAMGDHMKYVAHMIEDEIGYDPYSKERDLWNLNCV